MRRRYLLALIILLLIGIGFEYCLLFKSLGENRRFQNAILSAGVFAAMAASVIALSSADPRRKLVKIEITPAIKKTLYDDYDKKDLSPDLEKEYRGFPDPIRASQVHFQMTNVSGFTLKKPVITFRLPLERQHPVGEKPVYFARGFNSNLYNDIRELTRLKFGDTYIISNSNLPYWNEKDEMDIWIRMVLDNGKTKSFVVEISVNCDNADGVTKKVHVEAE